MTELQDLLARATDRIEPPRGAAAALLTARARRRRRRGAVAGAVVAGVVAAVTVPLLVVGPPASAPVEPAPPTSPTTDLVVPGDAFDPADAADLPVADTVLPEDLGPLLAETPSGPSQPVAVAAWRTEQGVGLLGLDGQTWQLSLLDQAQGRAPALTDSGSRVAVVGSDLGIWVADVGTTPAAPDWNLLPFPSGFAEGRGRGEVVWAGEERLLVTQGQRGWLADVDFPRTVEDLGDGRWIATTYGARRLDGPEQVTAAHSGVSLAVLESGSPSDGRIAVLSRRGFVTAELRLTPFRTQGYAICNCRTQPVGWTDDETVLLAVHTSDGDITPAFKPAPLVLVLWDVHTGALARATSLPASRHVAFAAALLDGDPS